MAKAQTYAEWLSSLHVQGVHLLLHIGQQGDLAQIAPFYIAITLIRNAVGILLSQHEKARNPFTACC